MTTIYQVIGQFTDFKLSYEDEKIKELSSKIPQNDPDFILYCMLFSWYGRNTIIPMSSDLILTLIDQLIQLYKAPQFKNMNNVLISSLKNDLQKNILYNKQYQKTFFGAEFFISKGDKLFIDENKLKQFNKWLQQDFRNLDIYNYSHQQLYNSKNINYIQNYNLITSPNIKKDHVKIQCELCQYIELLTKEEFIKNLKTYESQKCLINGIYCQKCGYRIQNIETFNNNFSGGLEPEQIRDQFMNVINNNFYMIDCERDENIQDGNLTNDYAVIQKITQDYIQEFCNLLNEQLQDRMEPGNTVQNTVISNYFENQNKHLAIYLYKNQNDYLRFQDDNRTIEIGNNNFDIFIQQGVIQGDEMYREICQQYNDLVEYMDLLLRNNNVNMRIRFNEAQQHGNGGLFKFERRNPVNQGQQFILQHRIDKSIYYMNPNGMDNQGIRQFEYIAFVHGLLITNGTMQSMQQFFNILTQNVKLMRRFAILNYLNKRSFNWYHRYHMTIPLRDSIYQLFNEIFYRKISQPDDLYNCELINQEKYPNLNYHNLIFKKGNPPIGITQQMRWRNEYFNGRDQGWNNKEYDQNRYQLGFNEGVRTKRDNIDRFDVNNLVLRPYDRAFHTGYQEGRFESDQLDEYIVGFNDGFAKRYLFEQTLDENRWLQPILRQQDAHFDAEDENEVDQDEQTAIRNVYSFLQQRFKRLYCCLKQNNNIDYCFLMEIFFILLFKNDDMMRKFKGGDLILQYIDGKRNSFQHEREIEECYNKIFINRWQQ